MVQQDGFFKQKEHGSINDEFFRTLAKGVLNKKRKKAKKEDDVQILQV